MLEKKYDSDACCLFDKHFIVRRFFISVGVFLFCIAILGHLFSSFLFIFRGGSADVFAFPVIVFFISYLFFFLSFLLLDLNFSVDSSEFFSEFDRIVFWRFGFVSPFEGWLTKPLVGVRDKISSIILRYYCGDEIVAVFFVTLYFVLSFFFDFDKMVKRYSAGGGVFLCSLLLMMVYCAASSGLVFLLRLYCRIVGVKSKQ